MPVPQIPPFPSVKQRPTDPGLVAHPGHGHPCRRPLDDVPPNLHYLVYEGHRVASPLLEFDFTQTEDAAPVTLFATRPSAGNLSTPTEHRTL